MELTDIDRKLLTRIQDDFPLVERPFQVLGEALGISEDEALARIQALKKAKIIRQISAIFDTRSMGYRSSLVAMKLDPTRILEGARIINEHPGVTHNYRRNHEFNLWLTVAVSPKSQLGLEKTVELLGAVAGSDSTRLMPTLKLYKIGVNLDMTVDVNLAKTDDSSVYNEDKVNREDLLCTDIAAVRQLQEDIRLTLEPFESMAQNLGVSQGELFEIARRFIRKGQMRRFAAILYHRRAGFMANAMGVWAVPPGQIDEMGARMARYKAVSHCYRRPTYPDWPYPLFSMVHGKTGEECEKILKTISEETGLTDYRALYSTVEYKKTRVKYFSPEFDAWEEKYARTPNRLMF